MNYTLLRTINDMQLNRKNENEESLCFFYDFYMFHLSSFVLSLYRDIKICEVKNGPLLPLPI